MLSPLQKCAVVIPVYKWPLNHTEAISVHKTIEILNKHDIFFIGPKKLQSIIISEYANKTINFISFKNCYFKSIHNYNSLLMNKLFYKKFTHYNYILIVQTDALIIRDELDYWCDSEISYVGAPWVKKSSTIPEDINFTGVGNGGLSLRNITNILKFKSKLTYTPNKLRRINGGLSRRFFRFIKNQIIFAFNFWPFMPKLNEDVYWGIITPKYCNFFCVPTPDKALYFSFELEPEAMFKITSGKLPMGCHAWERYDKSFWLRELGEDYFKVPLHLQDAFQNLLNNPDESR